MTADERRLDVRNIWMNAATIVAVVGMAIYFTWALSGERTLIYAQIGDNAEKIDRLAKSIDQLVTKLDSGTEKRFTKEAWMIECLRHQILNPDWKCEYAPASWGAKITQLPQE